MGTVSATIERWLSATKDALDEGVAEKELRDLLAAVCSEARPGGLRVYGEIPAGCIDLPSACKKYGLNPQTIHTWVRRGQLAVYGRLRSSARGGGRLLLSEVELASHLVDAREPG